MYEINITKQAQEQMAEIVEYISTELANPEAAINLLDSIENTIMSLGKFPERYQLVDNEPWRKEGIRKTAVDNFIIYYWVNKDEMEVQITAIIYAKRDQLEQLKHLKVKKTK